MIERDLSAYYYSFEPTGHDGVDAILEAVARAGKAYHHTSYWSDSDDGEPSFVDHIQQAANELAAALAQPTEAPDGQREG